MCFSFPKTKGYFPPLVLYLRVSRYLDTGQMGNQAIAMQMGKGTKTYQNLMSCVFIPVLIKKKPVRLKVYQKGYINVNSRAFILWAKVTHECSVDRGQGLSTQVCLRWKSRLYGFTSYLENFLWSHLSWIEFWGYFGQFYSYKNNWNCYQPVVF